MGARDVALVVPSIREASFGRFVSEWSKYRHSDGSTIFDRCTLILVEDNPKSTFEIKLPEGSRKPIHASWESIEKALGEKSWIIPRRSDTVRSFGYWLAWSMGFEFIMTLDDDCYPHASYTAPDLTHLEMIEDRSRWYNTLTNVKPRGIPFKNVGVGKSHVLNHGLWTNVLDYDAPTQLVDPRPESFDNSNRTVPARMYYPMCGMNLMWRADVTFAMYHLLMGCVDTKFVPKHCLGFLDNCSTSPSSTVDHLLAQLPFDRFGDIWAGLLSKKMFDVEDLNVSTGAPYIHHDRASDPFTNLRKEANGLQVNESLWEIVDNPWPFSSVECNSPLDTYRAVSVGTALGAVERFSEHRHYFGLLANACNAWCDLFESHENVLQRK